MKNYKVPVVYISHGYVDIEADNFDEAVDVVKQDEKENDIRQEDIEFASSYVEIDDERLLEFENEQT